MRLLAEADRVFAALLDLPPGQRAAAARQHCAGQPQLLALVQRLLRHSEAGDSEAGAAEAGAVAAGDALRQGALWQDALRTVAEPDVRRAGDSLGEYRLLRRLGQGGSAEVWLAERNREGVQQRVAIKLMLAEAADAVGQQRFRQEQQILARLDHPNIARIVDFGFSSGGRPWFAMEYVEGEAIDRWCDRQRLDPRQRLQLLLPVVEAVAHAHAALVVHRDIKPGNVLVDAHGVPRLLDFGIAKRLDGSHADPLTREGTAPGTPGYASPEQLAGADVGIASDVYQLGMLASVLLTGQRPDTPSGASSHEQAQLRRRMAPSVRLRQLLERGERDRVAAVAAQRRQRTEALLRDLSGDIDQVVLKAIATRPSDRYATAAHFGEDLRNVLAHRPVHARAPTLGYVLARAVRRHALLSATLALALLGLVAFAVAVSLLAWRLEQARQRAEHQAALAGEVTQFLVDSFRAADAERAAASDADAGAGTDADAAAGAGSSAKRALDRAAAAPPERFLDDDAFLAQLHLVLGRAYESLHEHGDAEREYRRALEAADALPAAERRLPRINALNAMGRTALFDGRPADALARWREVIALSAGSAGTRAVEVSAQANSALALMQLGDLGGALAANQQASAGFRELYGPDHLQSLRLVFSRVQLLLDRARYTPPAQLAEAATLLADLLPRAQAVLGAEDRLTIEARLMQARLAAFRGELADAIAAMRTALPVAEAAFGSDDLFVLNTRRELGVALARHGQAEAGLTEVERALSGLATRFGPRHPDHGRACFDRALVLALQGRTEEARTALADADLDFVAEEPLLAALATAGD